MTVSPSQASASSSSLEVTDQTAVSGRAVTISDVALRAGVSESTVSRVMTGNHRVADATRLRVESAVRELNYVANAHARALAGQRSKLVAVLVDDITSAFDNRIAFGVEQQAMAEDRLCTISSTYADPYRELALIEMLREQNADAVVLVGGVVDDAVYRERMARLAHLLDAAGSRLVLCGRPSPGEGLPVTVVEYDNEGGGFALVNHLYGLGHERILFLGGTPGDTTAEARLAGHRRASTVLGLPDGPDLVMLGGVSRRFGYERIEALLAEGRLDFTAVHGFDDTVAAGALAALRDAGISVPRDISVVGYDDRQIASETSTLLTSVHIPHVELGRTAVRLALHRADPIAPAEQHVNLSTHLVVRESAQSIPHRPTTG
jgi:LacI family transcriptional regulator